MAAEIIIVSGFLGAGKTTLIQHWLETQVFAGRTAIVENDFGEVGVDAALLRSGDVAVRELSAGCICCSLSGDFVRALEELLSRYKPDTILIEPSGVGLLSDVRKACAHPRILPLARVRCAVTLIDIRRMQRYLDNFGAFYEDQIRRADAIVLTRVEQSPDLLPAALERVTALNTRARVFSEPLEMLPFADVLAPDDAARKPGLSIGHRTKKDPSLDLLTAEAVFDTVTLHTRRVFSESELHERLLRAEQSCGMLLRAKGVLRTQSGFCLVQYTEGETQIEPTPISGDFLCLIGQGLDAGTLEKILGGD